MAAMKISFYSLFLPSGFHTKMHHNFFLFSIAKKLQKLTIEIFDLNQKQLINDHLSERLDLSIFFKVVSK